MSKQLGFFTSYGIEYVYEFLGEKKISEKIKALQDKPTMGITFYNFLNHDPEFAFFSGKCTLWVYNIILEWFKDDLDLAVFLFEKSEEFNEDNYLIKEPLKSHWGRQIELMNKMMRSDPKENKYWENQKINPYWMEYHFFINTVLTVLLRFKSDPKVESILIRLFDEYFANSDQITKRLKLDEIMWPTKGLSNNIFMKMESFYKKKKDVLKIRDIKEKAKAQGWRPYIF